MGCSSSTTVKVDPVFKADELELLKKVFVALDLDNSGTIDRKELMIFCKRIGHSVGKSNVDQHLDKYGEEGTLVWSEFLSFLEGEFLSDCTWDDELKDTLQNIYDAICSGDWNKNNNK